MRKNIKLFWLRAHGKEPGRIRFESEGGTLR